MHRLEEGAIRGTVLRAFEDGNKNTLFGLYHQERQGVKGEVQALRCGAGLEIWISANLAGNWKNGHALTGNTFIPTSFYPLQRIEIVIKQNG